MNVVLKMIVEKLDEKHGIDGWGLLSKDHPDIVWAVETNPLALERFEWTIERDTFLKDNFIEMTDQELGLKLGVSANTVITRRLKLNLYKNRKKGERVLGYEAD